MCIWLYNNIKYKAKPLWKFTQWKKVKTQFSYWNVFYAFIFPLSSLSHSTSKLSQSESSNREKLWLLKSYSEKSYEEIFPFLMDVFISAYS